jgi:prophage DNA circulation protein
MSQRRSTEQPFDERLYGMFMEVFRATGTMPGIVAMERIRRTCTEIRNEFLKAGGGHEILQTSLNAMKPVVENLEGQINDVKEGVEKLKLENQGLRTQMQNLIKKATQLGLGDLQ